MKATDHTVTALLDENNNLLSSYIHLNFKPHLDKHRISTISDYSESQIFVVLLYLHCSTFIREYVVERDDVPPIMLLPSPQAKRGKIQCSSAEKSSLSLSVLVFQDKKSPSLHLSFE